MGTEDLYVKRFFIFFKVKTRQDVKSSCLDMNVFTLSCLPKRKKKKKKGSRTVKANSNLNAVM